MYPLDAVRVRGLRSPKAPKIAPKTAPAHPGPFPDEGHLLEALRQAIRERQRLLGTNEASSENDEPGGACLDETSGATQAELARDPRDDPAAASWPDTGLALETPWGRHLHASIELSEHLPLCRKMAEAGLSPFQKEVLLALVMNSLGLLRTRHMTCAAVLHTLGVPGQNVVEALRQMTDNSPLIASRMVGYSDEYEDLCERELVLDPDITEQILTTGEAEAPDAWPVETEQDCLQQLTGLLALCIRKQTLIRLWERQALPPDQVASRLSTRIRRIQRQFRQTLAAHPEWGLSKLRDLLSTSEDAREPLVLTLLLAQAAGLKKAQGLQSAGAMAVVLADDPDEAELHLDLFGSESRLVKERFIQPATGASLLAEDPEELAAVEFELSDRCLEVIGLERKAVRRKDRTTAREPKLTMEQLVLTEATRRDLDMAVAHAAHREVLMDRWGLGGAIAYGRAVTLLFEGPPGVGKTACAEALAASLGKKILVADYSRLQNCFVGVTEKNIAATFRVAAREDAVLFWDEADAMFFDRDQAQQTFEVRHVNVLLQELERFEGVCVLATNRAVSLDPALERRISLKVRFERPDRVMRRAIWDKLIPEALPLTDDVDLDRLAESDLTGGEIKNAVLNAARLALTRGPEARLTREDFEQAIAKERDGRLRDRRAAAGIGFVAEAEEGKSVR
jgi:SpoVK/Ycf46/Vps4 family AAA+-type ATPase